MVASGFLGTGGLVRVDLRLAGVRVFKLEVELVRSLVPISFDFVRVELC